MLAQQAKHSCTVIRLPGPWFFLKKTFIFLPLTGLPNQSDFYFLTYIQVEYLSVLGNVQNEKDVQIWKICIYVMRPLGMHLKSQHKSHLCFTHT